MQQKRSDGGSFEASLKVADDARSALTEADTAAQAVIVSALRAAWPGLRIVGEEDDGSLPILPDGAAALSRDLLSELPGSELEAPLDAITIFVDPLDGTREFVEGRLHCVQSLVGIAVNGRATAGAIGLPFPGGDLSASAACVYGLVGVGRGIVGVRQEGSKRTADGPSPLIATGDSSNAVLGAARAAALDRGGELVTVGGAGHKLLGVADSRYDLTIMHVSTSSWDTCAPEALLRTNGGLVSAPPIRALHACGPCLHAGVSLRACGSCCRALTLHAW